MYYEQRDYPRSYEDGGGTNNRSTRERANAGLTLGIIGTALGAAALWGRNGGIGGILGGSSGNTPANVNINGGIGGHHAPSAFEAYAHECEDVLALTNAFWSQKVDTMKQMSDSRNVDVSEKFQLWKSQVDSDFGLYVSTRNNIDSVNARITNELFNLYKYTRDKDDETNARIAKLEVEAAKSSAIRPYQDKLLQCEIKEAYNALLNYVNRLDCRNIKGVNVLPLEPTVSGVTSYSLCNRQLQTGETAAKTFRK